MLDMRWLFVGTALTVTAAPAAAEMTHSEMVLANQCKRLTPDAMKRHLRCVDLMKRFPEALTRGPDMMMPRPPR